MMDRMSHKSLESAGPHDSDERREKNRILWKFVKRALLVVHGERFRVPNRVDIP